MNPQTTKVTCDQVISAADKAINAQKEEIAADKEVIKKSIENTIEVSKELDTVKGKLSSPFRSPPLMVGIGLVLGIFAPVAGVAVIGITAISGI